MLFKEVSQNKSFSVQNSIIKPINPALLNIEIMQLPACRKLIENNETKVYIAMASEIPWCLRELGRLREISFREAGEGSGKDCDIDKYDNHYMQLFLWNKTTQEIIGGYRIGLTDQIVNKYGIEGLYTHSLFKYKKTFLDRLPPALELGRSFVRSEYQRNITPLLLLWKGICNFAYQNPKYCVLFGPVSISNKYSSVSQQLLIRFLQENLFDTSLGRMVKPRRPYKNKKLACKIVNDVSALTISELSELIASFEQDNKGVPVLIKQYLKMGGQMLGFNIDPEFGNCIDGLIRVDFRQTEERVLAKFMGKEQTSEYLNYHRSMERKAG